MRDPRTIRALVVAPLLLIVVVSLTSCSGAGDADRSAATPAGSESPIGSPASPAVDPIPDRLPPGRLKVVTTARASAPHGDPASLNSRPSAVFTDAYVVTGTANGVVQAFDRTTLASVWRHRLPFDDFDHGPCRIDTPLRDADRIVVLSGFECHLVTTYDLTTGRRLAQHDDLDALGLGQVTGHAGVDGTTYVGDDDGLQAVDPQGDLTTVLSIEELGFSRDAQIEVVTAPVPGDGLLVLQVQHAGHGESYVGVQVDGTSGTVRWTRDLDGVDLPKADDVGSSIFSADGKPLLTYSTDRGHHPAIAAFDPADGSMAAHHLTLPQVRSGAPRAQPAVFDDYSYQDFQMNGDLVVTPIGEGGFAGFGSVVAYDLAAHQVRWQHRVRGPHGTADGVTTVGYDATADHAYVAAGDGLQDAIVELDATTGQETARWRTPDRAIALRGATYFIDGDLVVALGRDAVRGKSGVEALLMRVGAGN